MIYNCNRSRVQGFRVSLHYDLVLSRIAHRVPMLSELQVVDTFVLTYKAISPMLSLRLREILSSTVRLSLYGHYPVLKLAKLV